MHRFYVEPENVFEDYLIISGSDARHAVLVMRLAVGDEILAIDGLGREHLAKIDEISSSTIEAKILETNVTSKEPKLKLTLVQSILKGDKMDYIIQKCTELGVSSFIPCDTARSIIRCKEYNKSNKISRLRRIALEASKQCGRSVVPFVSEAMDFDDLIEYVSSKRDECIFVLPWELEQRRGLKDVLDSTFANGIYDVIFFVGPEGGFTAEEVCKVQEAGGVSITLGKRILRAETAAVAMTVMSLFSSGDMG